MIIGFAGKKLVGKDTAGLYVAQKYGLKKVAFADLLKKIAFMIWRIDFSTMDPAEKERKRIYLQALGDIVRDIDDESWVNALFYNEGHDNLVICDVRYPNEVVNIKDMGGFVIKIERNTGLEDGHRSENSMDQFKCFDAVFTNDGSIHELHSKIDNFIEDRGLFKGT